MKKTNKSNLIKRAAGDQNKKNVLKLGLYLKAGNGLQPEALGSTDLKNGWYVYSYKKPEKTAANKATNKNTGIALVRFMDSFPPEWALLPSAVDLSTQVVVVQAKGSKRNRIRF